MADGSLVARTWSPMQLAIFDEVEKGKGHIVVEALAGTGKSTTIEEIVRRTDADANVLVCAFNASIVKALEPRMPAGVVVSTFHSFGMRALGATSDKRLTVNRFRVADMLQGMIGRDFSSRDARAFVAKLVGVAKGQAFDALTESRVKGDKFALLDYYGDAFGLDAPKGWDRSRLVALALQVLRSQQEAGGSEIDFDDMIWLPIVRNITLPEFDFVLVDETQDLNPTQLEIAKRAGREGRIIAVGDRHQAIYGFRGADREAIPRMIRELNATVLPLSVTYRCATSIVAEANEFVPALQAAPGAPLGSIRHVGLETLESAVAPGDFVLSRTNAPLVSLAFRLIAAGRRATIQGRDIGSGLAAWVKGTKASTIAELSCCIRDWRIAEVARLDALERDTESVTDRAACLEALTKGVKTVADVVLRIEALFSDAEDASGRVLLSSTHRAKGLEAERVWMLRDTYLKRDGAEEENLAYVAITRAKSELCYVYSDAASLEEALDAQPDLEFHNEMGKPAPL